MKAELGEVAELLVAAADAAAKERRPVMIGIDGPACSGKSTLADALQAVVPDTTIISTDDFFVPLTHQILARSRGEDLSAGVPHLRWDDLRGLLLRLSDDQQASYVPYQWGSDRLDAEVVVQRCRCVVVEGLYALHPQLASLYSLKIWVDCRRGDRMEEARARMLRAGLSDTARWLELWNELYVPRERAYMSTLKPDRGAHVLVLGRGLTCGTTREAFAWEALSSFYR